MASEKSAIEVLADGIRSGECDILVSEVLVPEQCMCVAIGDKLYSVSAEEMTEEVVKGYNDKPATLSPEFLRQAQAAVRRAEKELESIMLEPRFGGVSRFDVIALDFAQFPLVMCSATSISDLFDQIGPWVAAGQLDLSEKLTVARMLMSAQACCESLDCSFTPKFQVNDDFPTIIIQMS